MPGVLVRVWGFERRLAVRLLWALMHAAHYRLGRLLLKFSKAAMSAGRR